MLLYQHLSLLWDQISQQQLVASASVKMPKSSLFCCGGEGVKLDWLPTSEGPQDVACVIFVFIFCFQLLSVAVSSVNWHKQDFCFLWLFHSCIQRHFPQIVFQNKLNPKWAEAIRRMWKKTLLLLYPKCICVCYTDTDWNWRAVS